MSETQGATPQYTAMGRNLIHRDSHVEAVVNGGAQALADKLNAHDRLLAVEKAARELVAAIELDWAQGLRILASTSEAIGNLMDALDIDREEAPDALPDA